MLWLQMHKLEKYFHDIHTGAKFFSKNLRLKKMIKAAGIDLSETYYIGDETRDIEAAHNNGIISVAVTWGYNALPALMKYQPQFIAHTPSDILTICKIS